jgi:hypothetical protein
VTVTVFLQLMWVAILSSRLMIGAAAAGLVGLAGERTTCFQPGASP